MSGEAKGAVRPVIPRQLVDQVVEKANLEGEEMASLDPSLIIRVILRRYVDGAKRESSPVRMKNEKPTELSGTEGKRPPGIPIEDARDQLLNVLLQILHESVLDDGLTKPMGRKTLGKRIKASPHFVEELLQELIERKLIKRVQGQIGRRGPRYRLLNPDEP